MKFIKVVDLDNLNHYVNVQCIVRMEEEDDRVNIIYTTDGKRIKTEMPISEIISLVNKEKMVFPII